MATTSIDLDLIFKNIFTDEQQKKMITVQQMRRAIAENEFDKQFDFKLACLADICTTLAELSRYFAAQSDEHNEKVSMALLLAFNIIQALGKQYIIDNNIKL